MKQTAKLPTGEEDLEKRARGERSCSGEKKGLSKPKPGERGQSGKPVSGGRAKARGPPGGRDSTANTQMHTRGRLSTASLRGLRLRTGRTAADN